MKEIICLDFDGVINSYTSGWKGARNIPDPPVKGSIIFISNILNRGYDVYICSSRCRYFLGKSAIRQYLKKHSGNLYYEHMGLRGIEEVKIVSKKPPAKMTIDDRAITFKGRFPSNEEIDNFKPWYK